jgi:glycosyltransferase involved in cell wall biosynthesis
MRVALLLWPDTFEDWYAPLEIDRRRYLESYEGEWSITVARMLGAAGIEVHLVFATLDDLATEVQRPSGATVHFVPASPLYRAFRTAVWGHRLWEKASRVWPAAPLVSTLSPALLGRMSSLRPDVCVIQDYESLRFDVAAPVLRALGQRVVAMDLGASARPLRHPFHPLTARCAQRLLAINQAEASRARGMLRHPDVGVWPVPVRTDVFRPQDRRSARQALGVDPDTRLVVSVGRLHPVKGLHDLADACASLDCDLVLAGAGPEHDDLVERRDPRLRLVGWVSSVEAARWNAAADVAALASRQEGQPTAVLEALACGRAVVATAVGGVPEVVVPGETGWLVPPRDVEGLRLGIKEALSDVAEADGRGERGRQLVVETHAPEAATAELLRLLSSELSRR